MPIYQVSQAPCGQWPRRIKELAFLLRGNGESISVTKELDGDVAIY